MIDGRSWTLAIPLTAFAASTPSLALSQILEFSGEIEGTAGQRFEGEIVMSLPLTSSTHWGDDYLLSPTLTTTFRARGATFSGSGLALFVILREHDGDSLTFVTNLLSPSFPGDALKFYLDFRDPTGSLLVEDLEPFPSLGGWDSVRLNANLNSRAFPVTGDLDLLTVRRVPDPRLWVLLGLGMVLLRRHGTLALRRPRFVIGTGPDHGTR